MSCVHFQSNVPVSGQLALAVSTARTDVCALLMPTESRREEFRAGLCAKGLKLAHPFACPVAPSGRWKLCPYFDKPARRGHRRH